MLTDIVLMVLLRKAVETQQLRSTLVATHWRGPHCLKIAVILAVVHGLLGLSGSERAVEPPTLSPSLSPFPVPNKPYRFCGRKATCLLTYLRRE